MRTENRPDKKEALVTIDDAIDLADRLHKQLQQLGSYKYPLDIRRGRRGIKTMCEQNNHGQRSKNGSKIYIFNQNDQKP